MVAAGDRVPVCTVPVANAAVRIAFAVHSPPPDERRPIDATGVPPVVRKLVFTSWGRGARGMSYELWSTDVLGPGT